MAVRWTREQLYKHGGCEYCQNKDCKFNSPVANKETAELTKDKPYGCNFIAKFPGMKQFLVKNNLK